MPIAPISRVQRALLIALCLTTFFFLLGSRSLNEPDEGRYAEIAHEMVDSGDWLVPHLWFAPHLDKPPLTYWFEAGSMRLFGTNEWAVRLPLALAGLSGVWCAFLIGSSLAGPRTGWWSVVILQTSLLYFLMARMLTTDIYLTQFIAWAVYFFWQSWRSLDRLAEEGSGSRRRSLLWQLAAWAAMGCGFLVKGPVAPAIPLAALAGLLIYRRDQPDRRRALILGALAGLAVFLLIALPWYVLLFRAVPGAFDYMVRGQVMGHLMGTAIKNRHKPVFYFVGVLAGGFLPWTPLLGWFWRRAHWRRLSAAQKEGWVMLSVWAIFTFVLFSLSSSKLAGYILPMFPALAVMAAFRWPGGDSGSVAMPSWVWRGTLVGPLLLGAAVPLLLHFALHVTGQNWIPVVTAMACAGFVLLLLLARKWRPAACMRGAAIMASAILFLLAAMAPAIESQLRANQPLKQLGAALREDYRPGDVLVCRNFFPQGLPMASGGIINATNVPFFSRMSLEDAPFHSAGNLEHFGPHILMDNMALAALLHGAKRVLVIDYRESLENLQAAAPGVHLRLLSNAGSWDIFTNQ